MISSDKGNLLCYVGIANTIVYYQ